MEATTIACRDGEHNNKENIPPTPTPFSATATAKLTNPVAETMSSSNKCIKMRPLRRRKPLADVTNLYSYNNSVQSPSLPPLSFPSSSVSASALNSRKRKSAEDFNSITVASSNSKSLRMGFR
ncbi:hypothetical protein D8674_019645 [Pyrus ussuriensis x Pyrus communis]|uniref:Uncharacterized protein n=1 Tax=Pyrus ussuriensis x Pyrus communis TaxID=2448454 RepID=A0A5N5G8D3_9ROSA|nr:hypothetical protein D8674_019645 [Pyrus ussuriensis x Pyrus communis]